MFHFSLFRRCVHSLDVDDDDDDDEKHAFTLLGGIEKFKIHLRFNIRSRHIKEYYIVPLEV